MIVQQADTRILKNNHTTSHYMNIYSFVNIQEIEPLHCKFHLYINGCIIIHGIFPKEAEIFKEWMLSYIDM